MCKSISMVTICPGCFNADSAQAGSSGQHSETILCPEAFRLKRVCNPLTNVSTNDIIAELPHAQYNKLGRNMCKQCQPFYQVSSSAFAPVGAEQQVRISSPDFDIYEDLLGAAGVLPGGVSRSPARHEDTSSAPSRSVNLKFQDGPVRLRRTADGSSCFQYQFQSAVKRATTSAPGLPQFLRIASDAGWRNTKPLGQNLAESTRSQITVDFLKLVDQYLKEWRDVRRGYDWTNDARLLTHAPKTIQKIIELQADPDSILNQPGSTYSADMQTVIVTTKDGKVTLFDTSKQTKPASSGDPLNPVTTSLPGKSAPGPQQPGNGLRTDCRKYGNPFLLSGSAAAHAADDPATEPLTLRSSIEHKCGGVSSSLRIKRAAAGQSGAGTRGAAASGTTAEEAVRETPNPQPSPSKPKAKAAAPNKVVKKTKAKNKTPAKKDAEGKTSKAAASPKKATASPKKAVASPKKATVSPKKDKETTKAKPKPAAKGKDKDTEMTPVSEKEETATPSPSGRSLRVRK